MKTADDADDEGAHNNNENVPDLSIEKINIKEDREEITNRGLNRPNNTVLDYLKDHLKDQNHSPKQESKSISKRDSKLESTPSTDPTISQPTPKPRRLFRRDSSKQSTSTASSSNDHHQTTAAHTTTSSPTTTPNDSPSSPTTMKSVQKSVFSQPRLKLFSSLTDGLHVQKTDPILQFYDTTVYLNDLDNLRDNEWLNDNNISFHYEYLERTLLTQFSATNTIALLKPSLSFLLLHYDGLLDGLKSALPPIATARFIFLPINDNPDVGAIEGGFHWSLLVVSVLDRKSLYYDTLRGANYETALRTSKKLEKILASPLQFICVETPQQRNNSDCGVYVCEVTELLVKRLVNAGTDNDISLGLRDVHLSANRGRSYLLKTILRLIAEREEEEKKSISSNESNNSNHSSSNSHSLKTLVHRIVDHKDKSDDEPDNESQPSPRHSLENSTTLQVPNNNHALHPSHSMSDEDVIRDGSFEQRRTSIEYEITTIKSPKILAFPLKAVSRRFRSKSPLSRNKLSITQPESKQNNE